LKFLGIVSVVSERSRYVV
jgi:uncharacterized protein (DUF2062 family)